jgi:tight adherence protein B
MKPGELGALLEAGVPTKVAIEHLGGKVPHLTTLVLAAGGELGGVLRQIERQEVSIERSQAEIAQATALPSATRRLLIWLPPFSLLLAVGSGLVAMRDLLHPVARFCMVFGLGLLLIGAQISKRMVAKADMPQLSLESLQEARICLSAGMSLRTLARHFPGSAAELGDLIELSKKTGAGLIDLIDARIESRITGDLTERLKAARNLQVRLLIPLGLTTLPAFLLFVLPPIAVGFINN